MKLLIFIIFLLLVGAFFIISNENIKLNSGQNVDKFISSYAQWIDKLLINGKTVSGYVVRMEWLPEEGSIQPKMQLTTKEVKKTK